MIVGITGKYCAGKNEVGRILTNRGFEVIDVDRLGHRVVEERKAEIVERFGSAALGADGGVDRRALGGMVFRDRRALADLEAIVHPGMVADVERAIGAARASDFAINAAILFHMGLHRLCDCVLWVEAPMVLRIARSLRRDRLPLLQILRRMWAQRKLSPQPYGKTVDIYIVKNSGNQQKLEVLVRSKLATG